MFLITLFVITFLCQTAAGGGEWVFQKVEELNGLFSNVSYLFSTGTTQDTVFSCFQYCALTQECNVVIATNSECYCSKYPTNETYSTSSPKYTVDRKVYFKRPVRVCEKHDYIYYKDMCFKPGNSKKTWTDAKKDCERSGGKLISIDTETKLSTTIDFLMNIYPNIKGYRFVGATDEGDEGKWKWINGDTDSFNQFSWFKLNNADDDFTGMPANCGALGTARYAIIDEYCLQDHNYICESV